MRVVPSHISDLVARGGPFIGDDGAPHGRVTVEPNWMLNTTTSITTDVPSKLPFRWFQNINGGQVEVEVPNVKTIQIDRQLDVDAATCEVQIYNQWMDGNMVPGTLGQLGNPGYFTWNYGEGDAAARWGQQTNSWNEVLIPNALLRTYQGYGGRDKTISQALIDGNLMLTGVWMIDEVSPGTNGMLSLKCRDMMKLLIEQQVFPPLMPNGWYVLHYFRWVENTETHPAVPGFDLIDPAPGGVTSGPGGEGRRYVSDACVSADGKGYYLLGSDGAVFPFGVPFYGDRGAITDLTPMTTITADPLNRGYWTGEWDGGVFTFGETGYYGNAFGSTISPVSRMEAHPSGRGYWLVTESGAVFAFGAAQHHGDNPGTGTNIIDIVSTPSGNGYWLLSAGGAVFTYGDALFYGNASAFVSPPLEYAVGMAARSDGLGYWVTTNVGHVHQFGIAYDYGSIPDGTALNDPITAIASTPTDNGYILVAGDGGVWPFGDAPGWGSLPAPWTVTTKTDGDYKDYADIVKDLLRWSGFLAYGDGGDSVYGTVETTGAWAEEELDPSLFDKKPVIDAIKQLKEIVGYHLFVDEEGAVNFVSPNWYQIGNMLPDGTRVGTIPVVDEMYHLTDYQVTYHDQSVRSEIIVSNLDPTARLDGTVTTRRVMNDERSAKLLRGMVRPAMWVNDAFLKASEQQRMVERIIDHIIMSYRLGQVQCSVNPAIQINDQVRIYERQTGETFLHYVRGVRTEMDLDSGSYLATLTTNWLGDNMLSDSIIGSDTQDPALIGGLPDPATYGSPGSIFVDAQGNAFIINSNGQWQAYSSTPPPPPPTDSGGSSGSSGGTTSGTARSRLGVAVPDFSLSATQSFEASVDPVTFCMVFAEDGSTPPARIGTHSMFHSPKWPLGVTASHVTNYCASLIAGGQSDATIRPFFEFNGSFMADWYTTDAAYFISEWQRIVGLCRSVSGQAFKFDWCPAFSGSSMTGGDQTFIEDHYPGNSYVDYISLDMYGQSWPIPGGGWNDGLRQSQARPQRVTWTTWLHSFAASKSKKFGYSECGMTTRIDGAGTGDDIYYAQDLVSEAQNANCHHVLYFNYNASDGDHRVSVFPNARAALASGFA